MAPWLPLTAAAPKFPAADGKTLLTASLRVMPIFVTYDASRDEIATPGPGASACPYGGARVDAGVPACPPLASSDPSAGMPGTVGLVGADGTLVDLPLRRDDRRGLSAEEAELVGWRPAVTLVPVCPFVAGPDASAGVAGDRDERDLPSPDFERARGRASSMLRVRFGACVTAGSDEDSVGVVAAGEGAGAAVDREVPPFEREGRASDALSATMFDG